MDMFSILSGSNLPSKKSKSLKSRGGWEERRGLVVRVMAHSLLFFDDDSAQEIFIPISQIKDWWFTSSRSKRTLSLADLELDDEVTLLLPRWLCIKEKML